MIDFLGKSTTDLLPDVDRPTFEISNKILIRSSSFCKEGTISGEGAEAVARTALYESELSVHGDERSGPQ